ncbi:hypothetical protein EJ110_NYTH43156 [Nymphaea thermarum]|nr:hypothetical protein EJ110_NYTH43156 [Nymphaea thermarum]
MTCFIHFATLYLTLQSIRTNKIALKNMFLSQEFQGSDYYTKNPKGKEVMQIITQDERFWKAISYIIKVTLPLVKVLRVVDLDEKPVMNNQMHHRLYVAGCYLNPLFHYDDDVLKNRRIKAGLMECLEIMVPTIEERCDILDQLASYGNEVGEFADWWNTFGDDTNELNNFAMRILNLTCSASGCERN